MPFLIPDPFIWDTSFQYFELDDEHKCLFKGVFNLCNDNDSSNLKILYRVTEHHFRHEEDYMKNADYSGHDSHKGQHDDFLAMLRSFSAPVSTDDLYNIKDWLVYHVKGIDIKYKQKL